MTNHYLVQLRDEFHAHYETDLAKARAAEGQIRKILGPLTDEEERYFFSRETPPTAPTQKAKAPDSA